MIPGAAVILVVVAIIVPAFFILMWVVGGYNRLAALRSRYKSAYAQIDVQLKAQYDLVPKVVETAKGYIKEERGTLEAVLAARNAASAANIRAAHSPGDPGAMREVTGAEGALNGTLRRLLVLTEAYPDLKTDKTMLSLMEELTSIDTKLTVARQAYNDGVMSYNMVRATFPTSMIALPFSFGPAEPFMIKEEEKVASKVSSS